MIRQALNFHFVIKSSLLFIKATSALKFAKVLRGLISGERISAYFWITRYAIYAATEMTIVALASQCLHMIARVLFCVLPQLNPPKILFCLKMYGII